MYRKAITTGMQRITAMFVSIVMVTSLALPISVFADSTPITETTASSSTTEGNNSAGASSPTVTSDIAPSQDATPQQLEQSSSSENSATPPSSSTSNQNSHPQSSTNVSSTAPTTQSTAETNASINNAINSGATSGNATANQNTTAGNVTTGNAEALATIVNLLQSNVNLNGAQPITFIQDITDTVHGDLIIDPAVIASLGTTSNLFGDNYNGDSSVDASTQASINNSLNITANSGNATANQNTTVGNITSGDANAVANVVNLINSSIAAGQSFVGMINIYGSLQGNILVPEAFVNSILGTGSNTPTENGTIVTTDNNATVTNTINTSAATGTATATDNTSTGSVTSGQANTNVTILNLTSNQTVGKNALLVFVNVLGNWVGLILDAPAGTTSASLGGTASTQSTSNNSGSLDSANTYQVNNTINTAAQSGNASAHENTTTGDIRSGDASSSVNLLNILNSQISLSDWFGILFINVFGTWNGNFGVQTATVIPQNNSGPSGTEGLSGGNGFGGSGSANAAVFRFVPANQRNYTSRTFSSYTNIADSYGGSTDNQYAPTTSDSVGQPTVLGATNSNNRSDNISLQTSKDKIEEQSLRWWLPIVLILALALAIRYYIVARRHKNAEEDTPI